MTAAAPPKAGRREWIGLAVLALPCLLYAMDLTLLHLAVPALAARLSPSGTHPLRTVDVFGLLAAASMFSLGTLGARIGRRRLLMIGAAAFGAVSVLAAFSTSPGMLIAARALLGLAGATVAPSTLSLIRNMFLDPKQRATAVGIWITSYSIGGAVGPFVGGALLEHFWWGSAFLASVPIMVLILLAAPILLPEYRDPQAGQLDIPSAALSLVAILAVIYGLKQIAAHGVSWLSPASLALGLLAGLAFVRRQRRLAAPLIDLPLFRGRAFTAALAAYLLATFVAFGSYVFIAQYLQLVLGLSPLHAGVWTLPFMLAFIIGSNVSPLIARRFPARAVVTGGLAVAAVGFLAITRVDGPATLPVLVVASFVFSLGLSPAFTLGTDMMIGAAPPEQAGAAAALSETGSELGGALGIAILGSLGTAVYRRALDAQLPAGVPSPPAAAPREAPRAAPA